MNPSTSRARAVALIAAGCLCGLCALGPTLWARAALWISALGAVGAGLFLLARRAPGVSSSVREPLRRAPPAPAPGGAPFQQQAADSVPGEDVNVKSADGIGYIEEKPAWFVRVVHPARFKEVEHDVHFKLFFFPTSALIAVLLRFFDNPDNPYCFHRVFDLSDAATQQYLRRLVAEKRWVIVVNSRGTEEGFLREVEIAAEGLPAALSAGERHLSGLQGTDGPAAVDDFLRTFRAVGEKGGFQAGWKAVDEWLQKRQAKRP